MAVSAVSVIFTTEMHCFMY